MLSVLLKISNPEHDFTKLIRNVNNQALKYIISGEDFTTKQSIIYLGFFKKFCLDRAWHPFYNDFENLLISEKIVENLIEVNKFYESLFIQIAPNDNLN